ncbi:unnamed protein product [Closterium sp. NIES-54]
MGCKSLFSSSSFLFLHTTVTHFLATAVTDPLFESTAASALVAELVEFAAACRLDNATTLVAESASASVRPPSVGDDLVFATADTKALAHVKSELQKRHTCTDLGELTSYLGLRITRDRAQRTITLTQSHMVQQVLQRFGFTYSSPQSTPLPTGHSLSAPLSDKSVEPSGPYPELVGCLITSGMGLVLGGWARVVLTGHADASWELRSLTYVLAGLGEAPRSPPVLYIDNKAMLALCQEHRLEHRTKHIALRYFLARDL